MKRAELRAAREVGIALGTCVLCARAMSSANVGHGLTICAWCRKTFPIQPELELVVDVLGLELAAMATGVNPRTIRRALAGQRVGPKAAAALAALVSTPAWPIGPERFRPPRKRARPTVDAAADATIAALSEAGQDSHGRAKNGGGKKRP